MVNNFTPFLIYNLCQLLFSIIDNSLFPNQQTDVIACLLQENFQISEEIHDVSN